ncbi:hypothetical protein P4E94_09940 [Pontiellaceae bacterium B12219]|nr:hypothetical protein [Pontiellaceae bacterium B12219]
MLKKWIPVLLGLTVAGCYAAEVEISSLEELADYAARSGNQVKMKPGTYAVKRGYSEDPKIIFQFTGSNNRFDLTDVRIEIDTRVYADMPNTKDVHGYMGFLLQGDHIEIVGGVFEDIGELVGPRGCNEFTIFGNDVILRDCQIIIRGSSPYGYGDLYGKGRGAFTRLQKHAAMSIMGDRVLIDGCDFKIFTYGHGIHMHGCQDAVIRNVTMLGALRLTDEIYKEKTGLAAEHDYKMMFPSWLEGEPIPKGKMLSLTEDGIRAYTKGTNKDGEDRHTGHITVENCTVVRMRGGIALSLASGATVTDCTVRESGGHAFGFPSNALVRGCKGDAAFSPLLSIPYSNRSNADIELELVETDQDAGDHPLAKIVGSGHKIKLTYNSTKKPKSQRPIILGSTGDRYTEKNSGPLRTEAEK